MMKALEPVQSAQKKDEIDEAIEGSHAYRQLSGAFFDIVPDSAMLDVRYSEDPHGSEIYRSHIFETDWVTYEMSYNLSLDSDDPPVDGSINVRMTPWKEDDRNS